MSPAFLPLRSLGFREEEFYHVLTHPFRDKIPWPGIRLLRSTQGKCCGSDTPCCPIYIPWCIKLTLRAAPSSDRFSMSECCLFPQTVSLGTLVHNTLPWLQAYGWIFHIGLFRFTDDNITWDIDQQFMLGPAILISPVLQSVSFSS